MAKEEFAKGTKLVIRAEFTDPDANDVAIDPTTVEFKVRAPDGSVTTKNQGDPEVEKESVGHYAYRLLLDQEGTYRWRWTGETSNKRIVLPGSADSVSEVDF